MDIKIRKIAHVVLFVRDPESSSQWYCRVLGMRISARAAAGPYVGGIFLSFGQSDHDIALFPAAEGATKGREFEHIGLELASEDGLVSLRRVYGKLLRHEVRIAEILDHGVSVGVYFYDPDGHMLEIFAQLVPQEGGRAMEELRDNGGKAEPTTLEPIYY